MDPQAPTSFIPKKSLDSSSTQRGSAFGSLMLLIGIFIFTVSLLAAGGAFAYQGFLTKSIVDADASLQKAQEAFDLSTIQDLIRIDSRIKNARVLLQKHTAPSAVFAFLSDQTLQTVQFDSFEYTLQDDGSAAISLSGRGNSFASVALQSDQFGANKLLKDVVFSGIKVEAGNTVTFTVVATVDPALINYGKHLSAQPASQILQQPLAVPAASTTRASSTPLQSTSTLRNP